VTATAAAAGDPGRLGYQDAARIITAQYAGGIDLDRIAAYHQDVAARLLNDAQTVVGRAYAREYDDTARSLVADLRMDAAHATALLAGQTVRLPNGALTAEAASLPDGSPHPDPRLAANGWHVERGVFTRRRAEAAADREAC
jgi:hypothetical protein